MLSACSADIKKVALGSSCHSNTDCVGNNICFSDRCVARVDCNQDENIYLPQCPGRGCRTDATCPDGFCDPTTAKCAAGLRPACDSDDSCATSADGEHCLTFPQGDGENEENRCVECLDDTHCPAAGGSTFSCIDNACAEVPSRGTCESSAQCTATPETPVCNTKKKECVECLTNTNCKGGKVCDNAGTTATFTCIDKTVNDCRISGCADSTKICDAATGICRPCANTPECGEGRECQQGACVTPGGQNQCNNDGDCKVDSAGTPLPSGYNTVCNKTASPFVCQPCVNNDSCSVAGTICAVFENPTGGNFAGKVCGPAPDTDVCTDATQCAGDHQACVNSVCSDTCENTAQCHPGDSCDNTGHCVPTVDACPATPCTGGLVCVAGACVNCTNNGQCTAPDTCQNGLCTTPTNPTVKALGAKCAVDGDCDSGLCREFNDISPTPVAGGKLKVCVAVCARTNTSTATAEDCPTAPAAGLSRGTLPALSADRGFACAPFINKTLGGLPFDGTNLCLHADDFARISGNATTFAVGAFTHLPNTAATSAPAVLQCQSNLGLNTTSGFLTNSPNANTVCAAGCQSNADCKASEFPDYVCSAELVTAKITGEACVTSATCPEFEFCDTTLPQPLCTKFYVLPTGRNACQSGEGYNLEGRFCRLPEETETWAGACQSSFCAGRCLTLATATATTCTTDASCAAGQFCDTVSGTCSKTTEVRVNTTTCSTDAQCGAGNVCKFKQCYLETCDLNADCPSGSFCMNSKCHATSAQTTALCQDDGECGNNQACGGRCALFCDDRSTCTGADSNLRDKVNVVCGYWPGQPTRSGMNQRICRGRATATTVINHTQQRGQACAADTECVTEVCDDGKCTDFCGRAQTCLAGETCKLRPHATVPNSTQVLSPICVKN